MDAQPSLAGKVSHLYRGLGLGLGKQQVTCGCSGVCEGCRGPEEGTGASNPALVLHPKVPKVTVTGGSLPS